MEEVLRSLGLFKPEIALTVGLLLVVIADSIGGAWRNGAVRLLSLGTLVAALAYAVELQVAGASGSVFSGMLVVDPLGTFFKIVLILASLLVITAFTFRNARELHGLGQGEFHALILALTLSNLLLSAANDILMLYLALEMVSITSYVMVAYLRPRRSPRSATSSPSGFQVTRPVCSWPRC
jgi:NADH-quinone oxidoreductase subunit N